MEVAGSPRTNPRSLKVSGSVWSHQVDPAMIPLWFQITVLFQYLTLGSLLTLIEILVLVQKEKRKHQTLP